MIINPGVRQTVLFGGAQLSSAAKTIITAIESRKGSVMTSAQRKAIDTFIRAETASGRFGNQIKRLTLPIWQNASANAYDWVVNADGTFSGAPTHAAGYVQGDGSSAYYTTNASPTAIGMSSASAMAGHLTYIAPGADSRFFSAQTGAAQFDCASTSASILANAYSASPASLSHARADQRGIYISSRTSSTSQKFHRRNSAGFTTSAENTTTASGTITANLVFLARNNSGVISAYSNAGLGATFAGLGMSDADCSAFSANLKTLWESLTGLTLP